MDNILDQISVPPPATCTVKCDVSSMVINRLKEDCAELSKLLTDDQVLRVEMFLVNKLVYANANRLRQDKGFQYFRNIKRFYSKVAEIGLKTCLDNFVSCLPEDIYGSSFYLPSRQMLQRLLHQLIVSVMVLEKIVFYSQKAAYFFLQRMRVGHSWSIASFFLAVCSRVSYVCRRLCWQLCLKYNSMAAELKSLKLSGPSWPNDSFEFPTRLEKTLEVDNPFKLKKALETEMTSRPEIFKLLADLEEDDEGGGQVFEEEPPEVPIKEEVDNFEDEPKRVGVAAMACEDIGEVIKIEPEIMSKNKKKKKKRKESSQANFSNECTQLDVKDEVPSKRQKVSDDMPNAVRVIKTEVKFTGTLEEKIESLDSLNKLTAFLDQEVNDSANEKHASVRRQISGIVATLKKKKKSAMETTKLMARARDTLQFNLL